MEVILGFAIAVAISLTGVGAGTLTTPLLILFLRVPPAVAVGTALAFSVIVKVASLPFYVVRKQVNVRVLRLLLYGGLPGVIAGSVLLTRAARAGHNPAFTAALGLVITAMAVVRLYRVFRPDAKRPVRDRGHLLPWLAVPIGAEVGFSSAGAGALGSLLMLSMTPLTAAEVVGTDLAFGLILSFAGGSIDIAAGNYDGTLLLKLATGGVCGALTGSMLAGRIAQRPLRVGLLLTLMVLGCRLAFQD
jgi:uncharacterized membrane protein YfcA